MQSYYSCFPPPVIPPRESIISEGLKTLEQAKRDQQWLKNWIQQKRECSNETSLCEYRQMLIQHAHLLQQYERALQISNYEFLVELKTKIERSNNLIYNSSLINNIQKQIHRRQSKRARLRRQKEKQFNQIIPEQSINEKSFTEKIQDINSILKTVEHLKQLKTTRQQGQKDHVDNNTIDQLSEIHNICTAKLLEYKTESPQIELYNYLFNNHDQSFFESTNPVGQYFLRAHQNTNNLVQIRQTWDQYSSTQITHPDNIIPSQWHEPQPPCDSNWTRYIFNKHTQ